MQNNVILAGRMFFQPCNEATLIRPIAMYSEFLPDGVEVVLEANGRLRVTNASNFPEWTYEGLMSAMSADGKVCGTRVAYPTDGPDCKYSALFDERPMFDNLRIAFLLHAGTESKPTTFLACLDIVDDDRSCHDFAEAVRAWAAPSQMMAHPPDFGRRAWTAYLQAIRSTSYFFAGDELIAICMMHKVGCLV